jgi:RNA polymerase sigma factor for flagellar operon FliA
MQAQTCETHIEQNAELLALEHIYKRLDQCLGRPAEDIEICDEMKITLDGFRQILDRIKGLSLGRFQKISSDNAESNHERLIRYIPDASSMNSSFVLPQPEIQKMLAKAIEALPKTERLIASLYYHDEMSLNEIGSVLGINEPAVSQLYTKAMLRLRSKLSK